MDRAYSYLRFSTPDQQKGDSFRRQSSLAEAYAAQHGLALDDQLTFHDLGVSAYRGRNSETGRLGDFLSAVDDGLVLPGSVLLVESLDRISRQSARKALRVLEDIADRGVAVVTLTDGRRYDKAGLDNDPMSLLMAILTFIRANEESTIKASRVQAAWASKRSRASEKPLTAVCPAWLELVDGVFRVIPERAEVVRRIYAETVAGRGSNAIISGLNQSGVPCFGRGVRQGTHWHRSYVAKLLASPAAVGTMVPHRMEHANGKTRRVPLAPVLDYFPAVIDQDTYQSVQAIGASRQPLRGRHASTGIVANVFGGLARCPICAGTMTRVAKGHGARWTYLVCAKAKAGAGCRYHAVAYPEAEDALLEGVAKIVFECPTGNPDADRIIGQIAAMDTEIELLNDEIVNLASVAGRARSPAIAQRVVELETLVRETQRRQAELGRSVELAHGSRIAGRLEVLEEACRALRDEPAPVHRATVNAALRSLCSSVVVDYLSGVLVFEFQHGGAVDVTLGWPVEEE